MSLSLSLFLLCISYSSSSLLVWLINGLIFSHYPMPQHPPPLPRQHTQKSTILLWLLNCRLVEKRWTRDGASFKEMLLFWSVSWLGSMNLLFFIFHITFFILLDFLFPHLKNTFTWCLNGFVINQFFSIRFNGHLGKKGISGKININYEEKTLSIEVSCVPFVYFFCSVYSRVRPFVLYMHESCS